MHADTMYGKQDFDMKLLILFISAMMPAGHLYQSVAVKHGLNAAYQHLSLHMTCQHTL